VFSIHTTPPFYQTSLKELTNTLIVIDRGNFRYVFVTSAYPVLSTHNAQLTLVRSYNNHSTHISVYTILVVRIPMTSIVVFVVNVRLVEIWTN
jgi:hypothetical protein